MKLLFIVNAASFFILGFILYLKIKAWLKYHFVDPKNNFLRVLFMASIAVLMGVDIAVMIDNYETISWGIFILAIISLIVNTKP